MVTTYKFVYGGEHANKRHHFSRTSYLTRDEALAAARKRFKGLVKTARLCQRKFDYIYSATGIFAGGHEQREELQRELEPIILKWMEKTGKASQVEEIRDIERHPVELTFQVSVRTPSGELKTSYGANITPKKIKRLLRSLFKDPVEIEIDNVQGL